MTQDTKNAIDDYAEVGISLYRYLPRSCGALDFDPEKEKELKKRADVLWSTFTPEEKQAASEAYFQALTKWRREHGGH